MQTRVSLEDTVSEPYEKVWQDITNGLEEVQKELSEAPRIASGRMERMIRRRIGVQEVRFDQDRWQAHFTVSFRLLFKAAVVSNCIGVQQVDATTTQVRWDGQVTFPRGLEGWVLKRLYAFLLKMLEKQAQSEVLEALRRGAKNPAEAIDSEGWLHTGDLATMNAQGYVNIVGRLKEMVIRGGENLFPSEVEQFLIRHPKVADVQVLGVPDPFFGEELLAVAIPKAGEQLTEQELREFCKGRISHQKIPRYFQFVDAYPMTTDGKVQKFVLREQAIKTLGLEDVAKIRTA